VTAEFIGTAFLLAGIVGSGIMASRLTPDSGLQLLQNAFATAALLTALILALGPLSGGHFNPAVTGADWWFGGLSGREALAYAVAQISGGVLGVMIANLMFELDAVSWSTTDRSGAGLFLAEVVATFGLLMVIFGVVRSGRPGAAPFAVGAYIAAAFYFTSSTSFANPAVTIGRMFSDTFAGVAPASVPAFVIAEMVGMVLAVAAVRFLYPDVDEHAVEVVVPHGA
jgi:arsenate reductase